MPKNRFPIHAKKFWLLHTSFYFHAKSSGCCFLLSTFMPKSTFKLLAPEKLLQKICSCFLTYTSLPKSFCKDLLQLSNSYIHDRKFLQVICYSSLIHTYMPKNKFIIHAKKFWLLLSSIFMPKSSGCCFHLSTFMPKSYCKLLAPFHAKRFLQITCSRKTLAKDLFLFSNLYSHAKKFLQMFCFLIHCSCKSLAVEKCELKRYTLLFQGHFCSN